MAHEMSAAARPAGHTCSACGTELAPGLLTCPSCHRLVHAGRLKELAERAGKAEQVGDPTAALVAWQEAITLLPPETRQYTVIAERISELGQQVDVLPRAACSHPRAASATGSTPRWGGGAVAGMGTLALLAWKFKFVAVLVMTKAKFLLLGLTKASTFLSMFLAFGVYWAAFGAPFALGLVLSIYVHEMGHVAALLRYGVPASAPLFLPGLGAVIRLRQHFTDPRQDARVGLAGPLWGLAAAACCLAVFRATQAPIWGALAHVGAFINLFNLLPVWQLDGGRAFRSLTRPQRWLALAAVAVAWSVTEEGLLVLLLIAGAIRTTADEPARRPDRGALVLYVTLVFALSAMTTLPVILPK